jgi:hypothetical protein
MHLGRSTAWTLGRMPPAPKAYHVWSALKMSGLPYRVSASFSASFSAATGRHECLRLLQDTNVDAFYKKRGTFDVRASGLPGTRTRCKNEVQPTSIWGNSV